MFTSPKSPRCFSTLICLVTFSATTSLPAQTLDDQLKATPVSELAAESLAQGDAVRGAVVFFQQSMQCSKCHSVTGQSSNGLGPDLVSITKDTTNEQLIESVLLPSKVIRKGFESASVVLADGRTLVGILVEQSPATVTLRDASRLGEVVSVPAGDIDEIVPAKVSLMPAGQMNLLSSRQQFLDLIRYLMEVRDGGAARARELQPSPALLTFVVPEYEKQIDHEGFIRDWNQESFERGEAIYRRVCMNCHGTKDQAGSLPTSLKFASGKFRSGSDPFTMYQTLTRGFGLMAAQTWMVPSQKYDVIHYIRETYLKPHNPSQYTEITPEYLSRLPKGDTRGPEPSKIQPWNAMDYGPSLTHTYEVPGPFHNFAYKGIALRLDPGAGGVSRGHHWMLFDTDTLRMAAAWSAVPDGDPEQNFIDWRGIQFNGEHQIHPSLTGRIAASNGTGPGWANPSTGQLTDDQRVIGRDDRRYGPLPKAWGQFHGQYLHGQKTILSYSVGDSPVLEEPGLLIQEDSKATPVFLRTLNVGARSSNLILQVAEQPESRVLTESTEHDTVVFGVDSQDGDGQEHSAPVAFDGQTFLEISDASKFDLTTKDFTITATVRTTEGGTIFALAKPEPKWTPDGQTLFIRDGRLVFDIGWVGAVTAKKKINDGRWHRVAAVWKQKSRRLTLFVDGREDGSGELAANAALNNAVARIGFTSPNFPGPQSYFAGELKDVRFFQSSLSKELKTEESLAEHTDALIGHWNPADSKGNVVSNQAGSAPAADVHRGEAKPRSQQKLMAGVKADSPSTDLKWTHSDGRLLLTIPAGQEPKKFTIWMTNLTQDSAPATSALTGPAIPEPSKDLKSLTTGGPRRWDQSITTTVTSFFDGGPSSPFATDILMAPEANPWLAQCRFTGLDFFSDGRIAVCSWDGDVWIVEGPPGSAQLKWTRIASGLFQPLGLKILDDTIYLTCRDQLAVLRDLNSDGETDFIECLNNDHQVTEHFHEFAMGLQTDADGNFYYAKSGRHALEAVVPHHGTLLKVSRDGSRTEILANGFRAANGVCLNPDGSFVVTDQEGFWNPKNRINWVTLNPDGRPKFYGNMFGYHDVTDSSDAAMEPPLCWITNAFDRSPGELLWVESDQWGPLKGSLLNLSYGYGKVFLVPHESVGGKMQGGMIELPIPAFPTGVMRGRFHPQDGQLYLCGMFAWAGSATYPGGLYRLRATGQKMHLPVELHAKSGRMELTFTESLSLDSVTPENMHVKVWDLKRTANYGSQHFNERELRIETTSLSNDGKTLVISLPDLAPTWCMEIRYTLQTKEGKPVEGVLHNTVHALAD